MAIMLRPSRTLSVLDDFFSDVEDWFDFRVRGGQGLNIYETEDSVVAEANLPGIPKDKIEVTVDDSIVRINGQIEEKEEQKSKKRYFVATKASNYSYSFRIPEGVKQEPAAKFADGLLTLTFAKQKPKTAPVKKVTIE